MVRIRAFLVFSAVLASIFTPPAHAQSEPVRVAVIGLEHGHVYGFFSGMKEHPEVKLVGVVDPDAELSATYEKSFSLDHALFYTNVDAMVAATRPQALLVFTDIAGHRKAIEDAAKHHLPVMVEKPLTMSLDDALSIRQTARKSNIQVLVNYETTWYASNKDAYDQIRDGKIGEVRKVVIHDGHEGPKEIHVQPEFFKWLNDPERNGQGALYDFGCYGADLMTWFMHGHAPIAVTAVGQTDKPDIYSVYDDATIILRYPTSQAVLMPSWNWSFSRKDSEIYGVKGSIVTVGPSDLRVRYAGEKAETMVAAKPLGPPEQSSMQYLAAVVNGQLTPQGDLTALDTNMVVMQILDAARESARIGKTVMLKPLPQ